MLRLFGLAFLAPALLLLLLPGYYTGFLCPPASPSPVSCNNDVSRKRLPGNSSKSWSPGPAAPTRAVNLRSLLRYRGSFLEGCGVELLGHLDGVGLHGSLRASSPSAPGWRSARPKCTRFMPWGPGGWCLQSSRKERCSSASMSRGPASMWTAQARDESL